MTLIQTFNLTRLQPQEASLLVWANPVSLAATQGIAFAFSSSGYLDVSVPRVCLLISYEFRYGYHSITSGGFPHSEISGSKLAYSSPKHIGVRPVLHRLLVPRHPPCALSRPLHLPRSFVTPYRVSYNPKRQASWFGLIPFRSPLLRESHLLSLPPGT